MTSRDPARAVLAACAKLLGPLDHVITESRPWSSATFDGARHVLRFTAAASDSFAAAISELQIDIRRGFVADVAVTGQEQAEGVTSYLVEALTIEEG